MEERVGGDGCYGHDDILIDDHESMDNREKDGHGYESAERMERPLTCCWNLC